MGKQSSRESNRFFPLLHRKIRETSPWCTFGAAYVLYYMFFGKSISSSWKNAHFSACMSRRHLFLRLNWKFLLAARDCWSTQNYTQSWCGCDSISLHLFMLFSIDVALFSSTRSRWLNTHLGTAGSYATFGRGFSPTERQSKQSARFPVYLVDFSLCSWWVSLVTLTPTHRVWVKTFVWSPAHTEQWQHIVLCHCVSTQVTAFKYTPRKCMEKHRKRKERLSRVRGERATNVGQVGLGFWNWMVCHFSGGGVREWEKWKRQVTSRLRDCRQLNNGMRAANECTSKPETHFVLAHHRDVPEKRLKSSAKWKKEK